MREDEPRGSETTLSLSLSKSINEEALSSLSGIAEVGLDSIFEEGFLKDDSHSRNGCFRLQDWKIG